MTYLASACRRCCCTEQSSVGAKGRWELRCEGVYHLCFSVGLGLEQPDYDLDSEDEVLLSRLNMKMEIKPVQFETMMERLEKASTQRVSTHSGVLLDLLTAGAL